MFTRVAFRPTLPLATSMRSPYQITRQPQPTLLTMTMQPAMPKRRFSSSLEERKKADESWVERSRRDIKKQDKMARYCFAIGGVTSGLSLYGVHHLYLDVAQSIPSDSYLLQLALICCYLVCLLVLCLCVMVFVAGVATFVFLS